MGITINGKTANYQPNRPSVINGKPNRLVSPEINGLVPYHININGLDRPPVLSDCVLFAPLYHPALGGATFRTLDKNTHLATVTGATWGIQGRTFDGSDDKITIPNHAALQITGAITVEVWGKPIAIADNDSPLSKVGIGGVGYMLYAVASGAVDFFCYGLTDTRTNTPDGTIANGNWYHIVGRYTGSLIEIYVNNVLKGSDASTGSITTNTSNLLLGEYSATFANWQIGEVLIYNRALSVLEIQQNYLATKWRYV